MSTICLNKKELKTKKYVILKILTYPDYVSHSCATAMNAKKKKKKKIKYLKCLKVHQNCNINAHCNCVIVALNYV